MAAAATARETFQARADRALLKWEIVLSDVMREQGYLTYKDRLAYFEGAIADAAPSSFQELKSIAQTISGHFAESHARNVKGYQIAGRSFHELSECIKGVPFPERSDVDQAKLCLTEIHSSDIWHATLVAIESGEVKGSPRKAAAARGRPGRRKGELVNGERLRALRGRMTQEELAEKSGYSLNHIQRGEAGGTWSSYVFDAVAGALSVDVLDLKKPH